jgi:hypothetical protein
MKPDKSDEFFRALDLIACGICNEWLELNFDKYGQFGSDFVFISTDSPLLPAGARRDNPYSPLPMCPDCYTSWSRNSASPERNWDRWVLDRLSQIC